MPPSENPSSPGSKVRPAGPTADLGERIGIIAKSFLFALFLCVVKFVVHQTGYEPIQTLPLLTALMGGVVFTLAILLAGTLQDFKESERILGELVTQLWRLDRDLRFITTESRASEPRALVRVLADALRRNLAPDRRWDPTETRAAVAAIDVFVLQAARSGAPQSQIRTVQNWLLNLERIVDRIGDIIQTTFARAGYYLAGTVVAVALGSLLFTDIQPFGQGLYLFGFSAFLLTGLFLLIWDLDDPFSGHARISTHQLARLEAALAEA